MEFIENADDLRPVWRTPQLTDLSEAAAKTLLAQTDAVPATRIVAANGQRLPR